MTEVEFNAHRLRMAIDPDPMEKVVHLLKLAVPLLVGLKNSWGGKITISDRDLDPWETARTEKEDAQKRIDQWLMRNFGIPG